MRLSITAFLSASMLAMVGAEYFNEIKVRYLGVFNRQACNTTDRVIPPHRCCVLSSLRSVTMPCTTTLRILFLTRT
jgi:hypothetical protein